MKVFVSSTIWDLLDIRSEIENLLRDDHLIPIMSDRPSSAFTVDGVRNNVETCLVNIRAADAVIVILSNKYGFLLGNYGYKNISFTHLEYREARKYNKKLFVFVRDKLEADFNTWKNNGETSDLKLDWVRNEEDRGLFELLKEHEQVIDRKDQSNWRDTFENSIDLKEIVKQRFQIWTGKPMLEKLQEAGSIPTNRITFQLDLCRFKGNDLQLKILPKNIGHKPILNGIIKIEGIEREYNILGLEPGEEGKLRFNLDVGSPGGKKFFDGNTATLKIYFWFDIVEGIRIRDTFELQFSINQPPYHNIKLIARDHAGPGGFKIGSLEPTN